MPLIGPATGTSASLGIALRLVVLVFDVRAVLRFWLADHPWRRQVMVIYAVVIAMVVAL